MENDARILILDKQISAYRLAVIESGLKLESKGLRHSTNAIANAARDILAKAGIKPAHNKVKLYEQFRGWRARTIAAASQQRADETV